MPLSSGCEARTQSSVYDRAHKSDIRYGIVRVNGTCERNVLVTGELSGLGS